MDFIINFIKYFFIGLWHLLELTARVTSAFFSELNMILLGFSLLSWLMAVVCLTVCNADPDCKLKCRIQNGFLRNLLTVAIAIAQVYVCMKFQELHINKYGLSIFDALIKAVNICLSQHEGPATLWILFFEAIGMFLLPLAGGIGQPIANVLHFLSGGMQSPASAEKSEP